MKHNKLAILLASALSFLAVSCVEEIEQKPLYPTNTGEEFVDVTVESLDFQGRGGSLNFTVSASYDVTITADEWITMSSLSVPGDAREYVLTATVGANKGDGAADRTGHIYVSTRNLQKEITVNQPFYNRPDIPNPIKTADDFKFFIEEGAPFIEEGEVITLANDIDMKDQTIEASAEFFNGVLDGNGCTVRNMSGDKPLIMKLNPGASVSNLKIEGEYVIGTASGEVYFAPIVAHNYGTMTGCENSASITFNGEYTEKVYAGGINAYNYADAKTESCINRGAIKYAASNSSANAYLGGICGYSYGDITLCEGYGPLCGDAVSFSAVYYMGGVTSRQQTGAMTKNIVHKEAKISTGEKSSSSKSYVGGIVGYVGGIPSTGFNEVYADIEVNLKVEAYVGGLQGWQDKVESGASANTLHFEGSVVNSNITAYTKGKAANGNNPCNSAGFITGRFSGQSGKQAISYGNEENPIRVSGSMTSLQSGTKLVLSKGDYKACLCGDGSKSSVNNGAVPEAGYNTILYEVVGDGQTGPAEDLIVKVGAVKLSVPAEGGEAVFSTRGNYTMTVTAEDEWLEVSNGATDADGKLVFAKEVTAEGDGAYYDITVRAATNTSTVAREGKVTVSMPMGSTETVVVAQAGNKNAPASLEVDATSVVLDPAGMTASKVNVTANYDATVTADAEWVSFDPATVPGDETSHVLSIIGAKNKTGAARTATVTITNKDQVKTISLSQDKFVVPAYAEIKNAEEFVEFIENAGDSDLYPAGKETKLTADIDLKNVSFDAPASYAGTFDGNGKSIKNWVCKAPMFGDLKGAVKNLTIDSSCSVELNDVIATFLTNNNEGTIENCTNKAAMVVNTKGENTAAIRIAPFAAINKGTIKGCVNSGAIDFGVIKDDGQATYIGGMAGTSSDGSFLNCKNDAPLTLTYTNGTTKAYKRVGGITSLASKVSTGSIFNGCVNTQKGKITIVDNNATPLLANIYGAGIVAESESKMIAEMKNCKSFGDIYTNVNNDNARIAGLVANLKKWDVEGAVIGEGCVVNCNITAVYTKGVSDGVNPLNACGFVIGRFAGETKTFFIGSPENPVKYAGTLTKLKEDGTVEVAITADSTSDILTVGAGSGSNINGGNPSKAQGLNVKFEAVTKE